MSKILFLMVTTTLAVGVILGMPFEEQLKAIGAKDEDRVEQNAPVEGGANPPQPAPPQMEERNFFPKSKGKTQGTANQDPTMAALEQGVREKQMKDQLAEAKREVLEHLAEAKSLHESVNDMLKKEKDKQDISKRKSFKQLNDIVSGMKPKQAAQLFEALDENLAVDLLASMKTRKASKIISALPAEKSARLSKSLLTRNLSDLTPDKALPN